MWNADADVRVVDRPSWRAPLVAAAVAVIAIGALTRVNPADITAPGAVAYGPASAVTGPASSGAASSDEAVTSLRTRFAGSSAIEIWGRTTATDGAAIRLQLEPAGAPAVKLPDVPAVAGRFYAKALLPVSIRGRDIDVRAGIR